MKFFVLLTLILSVHVLAYIGIVSVSTPVFWGEYALDYPELTSYLLLDLYTSPPGSKVEDWSSGLGISRKDLDFSKKIGRVIPKVEGFLGPNGFTNWSSGRYSPYFDGERWMFFENRGKDGLVLKVEDDPASVLEDENVRIAIVPAFRKFEAPGWSYLELTIGCYASGEVRYLKHVDLERMVDVIFKGVGKVKLRSECFKKSEGPDVLYPSYDPVARKIASFLSWWFSSRAIPYTLVPPDEEGKISVWCGLRKPKGWKDPVEFLDMDYRIYHSGVDLEKLFPLFLREVKNR